MSAADVATGDKPCFTLSTLPLNSIRTSLTPVSVTYRILTNDSLY